MSGKDVEGLSTKPLQREVLIPRNRRFRVLFSGEDPENRRKWMIHLKEKSKMVEVTVAVVEIG